MQAFAGGRVSKMRLYAMLANDNATIAPNNHRILFPSRNLGLLESR